MTDLQRKASALRSIGLDCRVGDDGESLVSLRASGARGDWIDWSPNPPRSDDALLEAAVRAAVLRVAPGSFLFPWHRTAAGTCVVYVRDREGTDLRSPFGGEAVAPCFGPTYVEAWIEAARALVEAGFVPDEGRG